MGWKKKRQGKRRAKKKEIRAGDEVVEQEIKAGGAVEEVEEQTQANPSRQNMPADVAVEILSRLPLCSVARFTCVSKQWRSLVSDDALARGRKAVLVQSVSGSGAVTFYSIDLECQVKQVHSPWKKNTTSYHDIQVMGSCNGLLLVKIADGLFLWNPVTRYFKRALSHRCLRDDTNFSVVSGLCYDNSTDEYKVVMAFFPKRVVVFLEISHDGVEFAKVGSFRSKSWRRVRFPYKVYKMKSGPAVNGHLHWHVSVDRNPNRFLESQSHQILNFNPHTNQFGKVPIPEPSKQTGANRVFGLGVLDGCLSMVHDHIPSHSNKADGVEVLAMKEYGIQESWTRLFIMRDFLELRCYEFEPLCRTKDGKPLINVRCRIGGNCTVKAYDPIKGSCKPIRALPYYGAVDVIVVEESLVRPADKDWEKEELRGSYVEYPEDGYSTPCKWIKTRNRGGWTRAYVEEKI